MLMLMICLQVVKFLSHSKSNEPQDSQTSFQYDITWQAEQPIDKTMAYPMRAHSRVHWSIRNEMSASYNLQDVPLLRGKGTFPCTAQSPAHAAMHDVALVQHCVKSRAMRQEVKLTSTGALSFPALHQSVGEHCL